MASSSKKSKKHGRNDPGAKVYRNEDRYDKNKGVKLLRHLKRYPDDEAVLARFDKLEPSAQKYARAVSEGRQRARGQGKATRGLGAGAPKRPKARPSHPSAPMRHDKGAASH
jgi:hypothetical protein